MKKFKKIAAAGAALMMAVTGMTMGASAVSSLNWSVTNVNSHYLYNQIMTANGYNKYSVKCTSFVGHSVPDTYVIHYPYYVEYHDGIAISELCASEYTFFNTFSETPRNYYTGSIPSYGTEVHEVFRLYQPTSCITKKSASGVVKTVAGNK